MTTAMIRPDHRMGNNFILDFNFMPERLSIVTSGTTWQGERVVYHTSVSWHQMLQERFPILVPEEEEVIHVTVILNDWTTERFGVQ